MPAEASGAARLLRAISAFEKLLVCSAFLVLAAVIFADVVSREVTGSGLFWASQIGVWANVIVVMAGFGLASADGSHLRPRFADSWLPATWQPLVAMLQHALMALFCLAIGLLSARVVIGSWRLGEVSLDLFVPIWPVQAFLPLAFLLGCLRHAVFAAQPHLRPDENNVLLVQREEGQK